MAELVVRPYDSTNGASRTEHVRRELTEAIRRGQLRPGDQLPTEEELEVSFGVSRLSVREAMHALEAIGLVAVLHGRGRFVAPDRRERFARHFRDLIEEWGESDPELRDVRGALDSLAAERAAERTEEQLVDQLRALNGALRDLMPSDDSSVLSACDVAFHLRLARASDSPLLLELLEALHRRQRESRAFSIRASAGRSVSQHESVIKAVEEGDPEAARLAMTVHIATAVNGGRSEREEKDARRDNSDVAGTHA